MSLADRQKSCAACGRPILETDRITIEPLIDNSIRYITVHWGESTMVDRVVNRIKEEMEE